jgi:hypothetical protein
MTDDDDELRREVTQDDFTELKYRLSADLVLLREQFALLQVRVAAMEAQLTHIEPMVEVRARRTEKLVMDLQVELQQLTKSFNSREASERDRLKNIERLLQVLVDGVK